MSAISSGDETAFRTLLMRHVDALYNYAYRLGHSPTLADDLVQETWLAVWTKASSFKPNKVRLTTWLHRILHNKFIDHARKYGRELSQATDQAAEEADPGPDLAAQLDDRQSSQTLARLLMTLPENQRAALLLVHVQGFSNKEAAAIIGTSLRATESLLARARTSLKKQLELEVE
jgi:RNA polymerase sigma-70 factor (ECF subfamily)